MSSSNVFLGLRTTSNLDHGYKIWSLKIVQKMCVCHVSDFWANTESRTCVDYTFKLLIVQNMKNQFDHCLEGKSFQPSPHRFFFHSDKYHGRYMQIIGFFMRFLLLISIGNQFSWRFKTMVCCEKCFLTSKYATIFLSKFFIMLARHEVYKALPHLR